MTPYYINHDIWLVVTLLHGYLIMLPQTRATPTVTLTLKYICFLFSYYINHEIWLEVTCYLATSYNQAAPNSCYSHCGINFDFAFFQLQYLTVTIQKP